MFIKAIFAGWLIALMVWLLPSAASAKIWIIILITYLIGLGGFPHIIAGSIEHFYLLLETDYSWGQYLTTYFTPTLLGNILGGLAFVTALNYAQVRAEKQVE